MSIEDCSRVSCCKCESARRARRWRHEEPSYVPRPRSREMAAPFAASVATALLLAPSASAQNPPCGDTVLAADVIDRTFSHSLDPGLWPPGMAPLSRSDVHHVVTDPRECRRVLHAAKHHLPPPRTWGTHWVYRFGPYYAVEIPPKNPPGIWSTGGDALIIFRASDMKYVAIVIRM